MGRLTLRFHGVMWPRLSTQLQRLNQADLCCQLTSAPFRQGRPFRLTPTSWRTISTVSIAVPLTSFKERCSTNLPVVITGFSTGTGPTTYTGTLVMGSSGPRLRMSLQQSMVGLIGILMYSTLAQLSSWLVVAKPVRRAFLRALSRIPCPTLSVPFPDPL